MNCRGFRGRYAEVTAGTPLVLAMLNLNGLKAINDSGKYASGDAHLVRVARALEAALPEGGSAGRWGGDEFALLLPGYDEDGAGNCSAGSRCCCRAPWASPPSPRSRPRLPRAALSSRPSP